MRTVIAPSRASRHALSIAARIVRRTASLIQAPAGASHGFTLVEVLIALLLLALGLLGVSQLLSHGVGNTHSALLHAQAVNLVSDMAESIRANSTAAAAYDSAGHDSISSRSCASDIRRAGAACSPAQLAEDDLARWQRAVRDALPSAAAARGSTASVQYFPPEDSGTLERYRISISWRDRGDRNDLTYASDVLLVSENRSP